MPLKIRHRANISVTNMAARVASGKPLITSWAKLDANI